MPMQKSHESAEKWRLPGITVLLSRFREKPHMPIGKSCQRQPIAPLFLAIVHLNHLLVVSLFYSGVFVNGRMDCRKKVAVLLKNTRSDFVPSLSLSVTYVSNRFPKIRNISSFFSVIMVSNFLSPDESRAIPSHVLFGIFSEITGRDQRFFASIPHIQKKTAFVFHFHEKSAFCPRTEAAIHLSVLH